MPKRGDILLYSGDGFISKMIRAVTRSRWSHVAWVLSPNDLLEADWDGVRIVLMTKYEKEKCAFVRPILPDEQINAAVELAVKKVGMMYDYWLFWNLFVSWLRYQGRQVGQLPKRFFKWLFGRTERDWPRPRPEKEWRFAYICSELVAKPLFEAAGFRFRDDVPVQNIVPEDIWAAKFLVPPRVVEVGA